MHQQYVTQGIVTLFSQFSVEKLIFLCIVCCEKYCVQLVEN